jgi:V-type H+-transporting ATPase subunit e
MASVVPVLFGFTITVALMTAAALFTPKGPNQV